MATEGILASPSYNNSSNRRIIAITAYPTKDEVGNSSSKQILPGQEINPGIPIE